MSEAIEKKIRRLVYGLLSRRDHTLLELQQKLQKKGYISSDLNPILREFSDHRLIDDQRYIENYIHWRRARGYGPLRISLELQQKGISSDLIAEQLEMADNAWFIEARKVWQKHFKGVKPREFKDRAKQMRFLQYRGFTQDHIEALYEN